MHRAIVFIAQGFGIGWVPVAPGTFGSVLGVLFFMLLLPLGPLFFSITVVLSIFVSVGFCGAAEKILGQKDPGSVVIDEIIALPICFGSWVIFLYEQTNVWPTAAHFISKGTWPITLGVFIFFRIFDVWKPWPVKQSQNLRGGWGVTVDDVLAAVYVNVCFAIYYFALKPAI